MTGISNGLGISELNNRPDVRKPFAIDQPVNFYDTTLRDDEQSIGVVLPPEQKLKIARALDGLGVARIKAGFPRVPSDDAESFAAIAEAGWESEIWSFGRAVKADIDELLLLGARATFMETPTSAIKLKAYGLSVEEAKSRAADAINYARKNGVRVTLRAGSALFPLAVILQTYHHGALIFKAMAVIGFALVIAGLMAMARGFARNPATA